MPEGGQELSLVAGRLCRLQAPGVSKPRAGHLGSHSSKGQQVGLGAEPGREVARARGAPARSVRAQGSQALLSR